MCAILDANVVGQVFGKNRPPAAQAFFDWIDAGRGRLVVGGELRRELDEMEAFREWRLQAVLAGRITLLNDEAVNREASELKRQNACRSDDEHVIAVARLGGARCCTRTIMRCKMTSVTRSWSMGHPARCIRRNIAAIGRLRTRSCSRTECFARDAADEGAGLFGSRRREGQSDRTE